MQKHPSSKLISSTDKSTSLLESSLTANKMEIFFFFLEINEEVLNMM